MSMQVFSRVLSRNILVKLPVRGCYKCPKSTTLRICRRHLSTNPGSTKTVSDNVTLLTGLGLLGGALLYAFYDKLGTLTKLTKDFHSSKDQNFEEKVVVEEGDAIEDEIEEEIEEEVGVHPADEDLPEHVPFVLVGGGTACFAAYRAIKKENPDAKVLIIGEEKYTPYMRPPLSKELWYSDELDVSKTLIYKQWGGKERSVFYENDDYYSKPSDLLSSEGGAVALLTRTKVVEVDSRNHKIKIHNGKEIGYDKLLLATGGSPKNLDVFEQADEDVRKKTTLYRSIDNFRRVDKVTKKAKSIAIIGGGFLGSELACALAQRAKTQDINITQIFPEQGNMGRVLPTYLSKWTTESILKEGVNVIPNSHVTNVRSKDKKVLLTLNSGNELAVDHVIVAVGLNPNTELAKSARLEVDPELGGYRVNCELEARSDIWIAGDSSCFYDVNLGRRRVEHHDHAVVSGKLAGKNMTGAKQSYWHQSMFWSDLGPNIGYEAIGLVDSSLPTIGVFAKSTSEDTPKAVVETTGENIRSATEEVSEQVLSSENDDESTTTDNNDESTTPDNTDQSTTTDNDDQSTTTDHDDQSTTTDNDQSTTTDDDDQSENAVAISVDETSSTVPVSDNYGKGVIFYMKEKRVVGIVLWNIFERMNIARQIIMDERDQEDLNELAKHFNIHSTS